MPSSVYTPRSPAVLLGKEEEDLGEIGVEGGEAGVGMYYMGEELKQTKRNAHTHARTRAQNNYLPAFHNEEFTKLCSQSLFHRVGSALKT